MARSVAEQLAFRTATPDDAPFAADVMTALFPRSPWDTVSLRYWWSQPDESMEIARFIVLRGERPIGFAHIDHARWAERRSLEGVPRRDGGAFACRRRADHSCPRGGRRRVADRHDPRAGLQGGSSSQALGARSDRESRTSPGDDA